MNATNKQKFLDFDRDNPKVWIHFKRYAFERINSQLQDGVLIENIKFSHSLIIDKIRWDIAIRTKDHNYSFKINNMYKAYYARKFNAKHPKWSHVFDLRELKAA